jgi:DNA-binding PadR family transcriptional regulator
MSVRMTQITALVLQSVAAGFQYGGTVYPALRRLERAGLLKSRWEDESTAHAEGRPRRRTYALTDEGWKALPEAQRRLQEIRQLLGDLPAVEAREA